MRVLGRILAVAAVVTAVAGLTLVSGSAQPGGVGLPLNCQILASSSGNPGGSPNLGALAVDGGGQIHVLDQLAGVVDLFGADGVRTGQIDLDPSSGLSFFGLDADPAGSTYVLAAPFVGQTQLRRYGPDGALNLTIDRDQEAGWAHVASAPDGTIFAGQFARRIVERFDATGSSLGAFGSGDPALNTDLAVDGSGNVYLLSANPGRLQRYDTAGAVTLDLALGRTPQAVAVDSAGGIYVYRSGVPSQILVFDPTGVQVATLAQPRQEPANPRDLAIAPDGAVLLSDVSELFRYPTLTAAPEPFPLGVGEGVQRLGGMSASQRTLTPERLDKLVWALDTADNTLYGLVGDGFPGERIDLDTTTPPIPSASGIVEVDAKVHVLAGSTVTIVGGTPLAPVGPPVVLAAPGTVIQGNGAVVVLDTSGAVTRIGTDSLATPVNTQGAGALVAVARDPNATVETIYGVDAAGRVLRLDPAGPVEVVGPESYPVAPVEITGLYARAGTIWVADGGAGAVHVLAADGELLGTISPDATVPALVRPTYISGFDETEIWIGDATTNRLHRFGCDLALAPPPAEGDGQGGPLPPRFTG